MTACQRPAWNDRCCCNCKSHLRDETEGREGQWICVPDKDVAFSKRPKHGLCEMHTFKEQR